MKTPIRAIPHNLSALQAGRAVAAILVVLFHNSVAIFDLPKYWGGNPFGRVFDFGDSEVKFFFVLSGFIILYAHKEDLDRPAQLKYYAWKRFRRIYPIYWIILLIILPVYFAVGSFGKGFETQPMVILSSFLLVHLNSTDAVMVISWTLFHEVLFYSLFSLLIWRMQLGFKVLGLWLMLSAVSMVTDHSSMLTGFYLSNLHILFGFGMIATWLIHKRTVPMPLTGLLLGMTVFLLAGADEVYWKQMTEDWRTLIFGLGSTFAMIGLVELESVGRLKVPSWLRLLGDASYSIYLVHFFVLSFFAKLAWASGAARWFPASAAYVLLACLAIAAGVLCHVRVERPLLVRLEQKFLPARA